MSQIATTAPRTTLSWTNALAQALELEGVNSRALFEKVGVPYQTAADPASRIETSKASELYQLAVQATGNPAIGLRVALHLLPGSMHALGYSLYSSNTLHDFCKRLERYFRLVSDNVDHQLDGDNCLNIDLTNPHVCFEAVDFWTAYIVRTCRNIYRPDFSPLRIELIRQRPSSHVEDFDKFFKAPVVFSANRNAICFNKDDLFAPLLGANTELARRNDEVIIEHLARLDRADIVRQVEAKIVDLLPTGECSKERVASELNMSLRNLHSKLEQKSNSYQEIMEDLRSNLARQYVEQKNLPITEITYLLGFSDTSNFSRAFKRWTGQSPSDYRNNKPE